MNIERLLFGNTLREERVGTRATARSAAGLAARTLLAAIFLISGIDKFAEWGSNVAYAEASGLPAPAFFLAIAGLIEVIGALMIITGTAARLGAAGLFLYLIPVTLVFHPFWTFEGQEYQLQFFNFWKNLAIMGGLLLLAADGAGRYSVDEKIRERLRLTGPDRT